MARVAAFILIIFKMLCAKMLLPQFFKSVTTAIKKKILKLSRVSSKGYFICTLFIYVLSFLSAELDLH